MGTIIAFPAEARRLDLSSPVVPREFQATVLILPAIRIERHAETTDGSGPKEGAAAGRRRRRRARS